MILCLPLHSADFNPGKSEDLQITQLIVEIYVKCVSVYNSQLATRIKYPVIFFLRLCCAYTNVKTIRFENFTNVSYWLKSEEVDIVSSCEK